MRKYGAEKSSFTVTKGRASDILHVTIAGTEGQAGRHTQVPFRSTSTSLLHMVARLGVAACRVHLLHTWVRWARCRSRRCFFLPLAWLHCAWGHAVGATSSSSRPARKCGGLRPSMPRTPPRRRAPEIAGLLGAAQCPVSTWAGCVPVSQHLPPAAQTVPCRRPLRQPRPVLTWPPVPYLAHLFHILLLRSPAPSAATFPALLGVDDWRIAQQPSVDATCVAPGGVVVVCKHGPCACLALYILTRERA